MASQRNKILSFLLGLVGTTVVLTAGLFAYKHLGDATTPPSQVNGDLTFVESPHTVEDTNRAEVKSTSVHNLEDLDRIKSDYTRAVTLRSMLTTADERSVLELIEQSTEISDRSHRRFLLYEVFRRYAAIDPLNALRQTSELPKNERGHLVSAVFREWIVADPNAAIQQAKTLDTLNQRIALESILQFKQDLDYDQFTEISLEVGQEDVGEKLLDRFAVAKSVDDPKEAFVALLSDSTVDNYQYASLSAIAENWFDRDGEDALFEIQELAENFTIPTYVLSRVFRELARSNPSNAFELAQELSGNFGDGPLGFVIETWASEDPHAALQALNSISSQQLQARLQTFLGFSWQRNDPQAVLNNLSLFLPTIRTDIQRSALHALSRKSPREAAEMMLEISEQQYDYDVEGVVREWSKTDVREALDWVLNQDKILPRNLLTSLWRELVREDPELALKTALSQPLNRNTGDERYVMRELASVDLEQAIELLPLVREEYGTKYFSYAEVGLALVKREDSARALELGEELPEPIQKDYYSLMLSMWSHTDRFGLFEKLQEFPSQEMKSSAALSLLTDHDHHRHFTQDQSALLTSLLIGKDVARYAEHEKQN